MKHLYFLLIGLSLSMILSSCSTSVAVIDEGFESKEKDSQIDIYITTYPTVEYSEIAIIKCDKYSQQRAIDRIKKKARKVGADAVILMGIASSTNTNYNIGNLSFTSSEEKGFTAIAIKYRN